MDQKRVLFNNIFAGREGLPYCFMMDDDGKASVSRTAIAGSNEFIITYTQTLSSIAELKPFSIECQAIIPTEVMNDISIRDTDELIIYFNSKIGILISLIRIIDMMDGIKCDIALISNYPFVISRWHLLTQCPVCHDSNVLRYIGLSYIEVTVENVSDDALISPNMVHAPSTPSGCMVITFCNEFSIMSEQLYADDETTQKINFKGNNYDLQKIYFLVLDIYFLIRRTVINHIQRHSRVKKAIINVLI